MKFHIIALTIICVVITVLYVLIGPKPAQAPVDPNANSGRALEIYSATWGEDCNPYIEERNNRTNNTPAEKDEKGVLVARERLKLVQPNNVLELVGNYCNGQQTCEITPTPENMGINPLEACAKRLNISYRCYSYDRLWTVSIGQGENKVIDCNATQTSTPAGQ